MSRNVPKLRFKGFEDEWRENCLGEIGEFKNGINKSKEDFGFGVPFVNLMDVFGKTYIQDSEYELVNANDKEIEESNLLRGDVLFIRSSVKREGVGETVLVSEDLYNTVYSGFLIRFREYKKVIFDDYKKYCFWTNNFRNKLKSKSSTSANTNINQESLKSLTIKLPSLQEQEKIANFLSKVDSIIEKQEKKVEYWNSYKKGMMQKIFSQKIRFKDENGRDYPEWEEKFIGELCNVCTGKKDTQDKIQNGKYPFFVRSQTVEKINTYSFDGEAILTAGDGVGVGKVFHYVNCKFDYHQRVYKLSDFKKANGRYLYEYFSKNFKKEVRKYNAKTSVDSVRLEMITKMKIPYPCLQEQKKIANFLSNIDNIIEKETKKLEELKQWKKGLLQQMFV
ncbi:restriction endonuclease subunit S [Clostridium perfringens]|nr:restriction endonuclease subunit S [Clostridium perfringens]